MQEEKEKLQEVNEKLQKDSETLQKEIERLQGMLCQPPVAAAQSQQHIMSLSNQREQQARLITSQEMTQAPSRRKVKESEDSQDEQQKVLEAQGQNISLLKLCEQTLDDLQERQESTGRRRDSGEVPTRTFRHFRKQKGEKKEGKLSEWCSKASDLLLQINTSAQRNWLHISSDGSRLAIIWKHGGLYVDTDVTSIRPIPEENFLAAQASQYASNGVFAFLPHHTFLWECMEIFAEHYNSHIWGHQGPNLMTRMLRLWCKLEDFQEVSDLRCSNLSFLHPQRLDPFCYRLRHYYKVWDTDPSFNDTYALHLCNYMNQEGRDVSNTLAESLYCQHCPMPFRDLVQGPEGLVTGQVGPGNK
ncbi:LOW QUALITY PROTEIN: alpha-1,4-N-acetylglucosaminyltransferase-like [Glossophaga mutica]